MRKGDAYRFGVRVTASISPAAAKMVDELLATGLFGLHGRAGVVKEALYRMLREYQRDGFFEAVRAFYGKRNHGQDGHQMRGPHDRARKVRRG